MSACLLRSARSDGAGDVAAYGAGEIVNIQRHAVSGDGGAENGDVGSRGGRGLQRGGGVRHDEVHALGDKAVDDGGAVVGIAGGVLLSNSTWPGERLVQRVNKALRRGVQRGVLHELADADGVGRGIAARLGGIGGIGGVSLLAAGGEAETIAAESSMAISFFFMVLLLFI